MPDTRKIVKVFLASPSDLQEERHAAKSVVDEFNNNWADHLGYQVELVGWEDTVSVYGRPQATINRDLEQCEYFIGMMWKRWGTPPDDSGRFTSGFEEEFQTSVSNRQERGSPEISLFFKNIGADLLSDPGDELKKVLAFREKITTEKKILFATFDNIEEFQKKIHRCITLYVQKQQSEESRERAEESQARSSEDSLPQSQSETTSTSETPLSVKGTEFLRDLISKIERDAEGELIATADVARFRLLACMIENQGNDKQSLGAHDANILFVHRSDLELSFREKLGLTDSGLEHFSSENTPLWYWLAEVDAFSENWLQFYSLIGTTQKRVGALSSLRLVSEPLSSNGPLDREVFINSWFSETAPSAIKVAALRYLADCGTAADLAAIKAELDRGDYQTTGAAAEAILRINLRDSRENAILALFEVQPGSIGSILLATLFENGASIDTEVLSQGVGHPSSDVRRIVVKLLRERGALDVQIADQLISDSDAEVRFEALQSLFCGGRQFSDNEAKTILVKPKVNRPFGLFSLFGPTVATDSEGKAFWNRFREQRMAAMTNHDLEQAARNSSIVDRTAQFALDERRFSKFGNRLRAAVDDHFKAEFAEKLEKMVQQYGSESNLIEKTRTLEDDLRKDFTRKGLDIICRRGDSKDLSRVRNILKSKFVEFTDANIEYLRRFGEWEDISLIISALDQPEIEHTVSLILASGNVKYRTAARSIYSLGRTRLEELLSLEAPSRLLSHLIVESSEMMFRALRDSSITQLFRSEHDTVRKAAALKCILALPKRRLTQLLNNYNSGGVFRYYNVIHWLDLGVSIPRDRARSAAKIVLEREWPE